MESRVQLQAIYKCSGQLPSHNRQSAHQANINQLMLQAKLTDIGIYEAHFRKKISLRSVKSTNVGNQSCDSNLTRCLCPDYTDTQTTTTTVSYMFARCYQSQVFAQLLVDNMAKTFAQDQEILTEFFLSGVAQMKLTNQNCKNFWYLVFLH